MRLITIQISQKGFSHFAETFYFEMCMCLILTHIQRKLYANEFFLLMEKSNISQNGKNKKKYVYKNPQIEKPGNSGLSGS